MKPLTFDAVTIATVGILETGSNGEGMARRKTHSTLCVDRGEVSRSSTHGGMRVMSVLEPQPGQCGFPKVVSTIVQCSPLKPHFPERDMSLREQPIPKDYSLTSLKITAGRSGQLVEEMVLKAPGRRLTRWLQQAVRSKRRVLPEKGLSPSEISR